MLFDRLGSGGVCYQHPDQLMIVKDYRYKPIVDPMVRRSGLILLLQHLHSPFVGGIEVSWVLNFKSCQLSTIQETFDMFVDATEFDGACTATSAWDI